VREYAQARLAESGEQERIQTRHLGFYLTLASEVRAALDRPDRAAWLDRLEEAHPNVRAALGWAWRQAEEEGGAWLNEGLRLATAFAALSRHRGYLVEGSLHLDRLLALDDCRRTAAPATRAWALLEASTIACYRADYPKTVALAQRAIDLFAALGDSSGLWRGYRYLGEAAMGVGDVAGAEPLFQRELAVAREGDDRRGQGDAYNMLGQAARCLGRYGEANALLEQGVALFRELQDAGAVSSILVNLGDVARDAGDARSARSWYREAWCSEQNLANKRHIAYMLEGIAAAAALDGDGRLALVYLGAADALREEIDSPQPPADQARLARILTPVLAVLSSAEQQEALAAGRARPLAGVVAEALAPPAPGGPPGPLAGS